jgi:ABC-type multidrug transport system ATPase subunit
LSTETNTIEKTHEPDQTATVTNAKGDVKHCVWIKWTNIKVILEGCGHEEVLKGVTGIAKPGELTCLIGPSGAGKTTLLNVLGKRLGKEMRVQNEDQNAATNSKQNKKCEVLLNGHPYDIDLFKQVGAHLAQDDVLWEGSTPLELFHFVAKMKMPDITDEERSFKIDKLISILGLNECKNIPVGGMFVQGLSGGEKKRTSIGIELLSNPKVLLLDEPTSGLDSTSALRLIQHLKKLCI